MMYRWLVTLLGAVLVSGCANLQNQDFLASSSDFFDRAGKALGKIGEPTAKMNRDAEVQALFDQPYIDPLTKYLNQFEGDDSRVEQLARVQAEREHRCDVIFERYTAKPPTEHRVARYRAGYNFSCADDVDSYALMLKKRQQEQQAQAEALAAAQAKKSESVDVAAEEGEASQQSEPREPAAPAISQELNDCFLLTAIRNFSGAVDACRQPAEHGNVQAQTNMAAIAYALKDYKGALEWAKRAAPDSGDAANLLGKMYAEGQGVSKDPKVARQWYQQAASLGHAGAQATLDSNVKVSTGDAVR